MAELAFIHGYDSPEDQKWCFRFDALFIRKAHRRILNRQPIRLFKRGACYLLFDWRVLAN